MRLSGHRRRRSAARPRLPGVVSSSVLLHEGGMCFEHTILAARARTRVASTSSACPRRSRGPRPRGEGAIDLDNGGSTGTSDGNAELRDMGIDSLAGSGNNWRRRIGGINGTTVRYAGNIGVDFGAVASKEAIVALYNDAAELTTASTISDGNIDVWGDFKVSDTVNVGDVFVVYKSSSATYYLVVVNSVTENTTLGDNTDKYNVSIKY